MTIFLDIPKQIWWRAAWGLMVFLLGPVTTQGASFEMPMTETRLKNGLQLVTYRSHKVPIVTLLLEVKAGAYNETAASHGLTHLWQHLFFRPTQSFQQQEDFENHLRDLGLTFDSETSVEHTRFFMTMPSSHLNQGLNLLAEFIIRPQSSATDLADAKVAIEQEWQASENHALAEVGRWRTRLLYHDQSFRRDAVGDLAVMRAATWQDLQRRTKQILVPALSALIISGDFDPDLIRGLVEGALGSWKTPKTWVAPKVPVLTPFSQSQNLVTALEGMKGAQVTLTFAGPRVRQSPHSTYRADILGALLQQSDGRFHRDWLASGLVESAGLGYLTQAQAGEVHVFAKTSVANLAVVEKKLSELANEWLDPDYFTREQLSLAKQSLRWAHFLERDRPSQFAKVLGFWWAISGMDYYRHYYHQLMAVTRDDLRAFVRDYLVKGPALTTILVNKAELAASGLKDNSDVMAKSGVAEWSRSDGRLSTQPRSKEGKKLVK